MAQVQLPTWQQVDDVQKTADRIETKVDALDGKVGQVKTKVEDTNTKVGALGTAVAGVASDAAAAKTNAANAKTSADNAKTAADNAKTAAQNAGTVAGQAKTAAENAGTVAGQAKAAAENAGTVAGQAKTSADNAAVVAGQAKTAAEEARDGLGGIAETTQDTNGKVQVILDKVSVLPLHFYPVAGVRYHNKRVVGDTVELQWQDPPDYVMNGSVVARWARTAIYKRQGVAPTGPDDENAILVIDNLSRNSHMVTPYVDQQADGSNWVYRCFTYSTNGVLNDSANQVFKEYTLFGFKLDDTESDETACVEYIEDNEIFEKLYMDFANDTLVWGSWQNVWFMPKPCALKYDGTVDYYLDPNDYTKKADGTASDVTSSSYAGNFMMEWPCIYWKSYVDENDGRKVFLFANEQLDETFECWSCKNSDGTYADHFYTPIYEGYTVSSRMRSYSSNTKPTGSTNATTELTNAQNNGMGWTPTWWSDEQLIRALGVLVCKRLNFQEAICKPFTINSSALQILCGSGNTLGMFHGYSDGRYVSSKFFGMENWWGHRWRRCVGLNLVSGEWKVKMTKGTQDGSTVSGFVTSDTAADYAGYIATGKTIATNFSSTYQTKTGTGNLAMLCTAASGGSSSTFYCDAIWSSSGLRGVLFGGSVSYDVADGLFAVHADFAPSFARWYYGASLSYHKTF